MPSPGLSIFSALVCSRKPAYGASFIFVFSPVRFFTHIVFDISTGISVVFPNDAVIFFNKTLSEKAEQRRASPA